MSVIEAPTLPLIEETPAEGITLLPAAIRKVQSLFVERNLTGHALRVFVAGGGCSGMQYGMAIEKETGEFDSVYEFEGVKVVVDPTSLMYLNGATVDYVDNLMGGGFRIDNPNAVASCGCGHSFRTAGSPAAATGGGCGNGCGH